MDIFKFILSSTFMNGCTLLCPHILSSLYFHFIFYAFYSCPFSCCLDSVTQCNPILLLFLFIFNFICIFLSFFLQFLFVSFFLNGKCFSTSFVFFYFPYDLNGNFNPNKTTIIKPLKVTNPVIMVLLN